MWSWQSFVHQSPEQRARGRRRSGHANVARNLRATESKVQNWTKEKNGERTELGMRGILHAGCFLFHGLLLEYNTQSDCPVPE